MTDFALPDNYQQSDPELVVLNIPGWGGSNPDDSDVFYTTGGNSLWRLRYVFVYGSVAGTMGTTKVSLEMGSAGTIPDPWAGGVPMILPGTVSLTLSDNFTAVWSSEVGDSYTGETAGFGKAQVQGLPLVLIPAQTNIVIGFSSTAGSDLLPSVFGGLAQIEKLPPNSVTGGGDQLPDLAPVWYLSEDAA